jgi:hypothetical protein|tara:strand:+ start:5008 stop:6603 length:1596 start_codon:yes stop_codon:yes gene_type:complete
VSDLKNILKQEYNKKENTISPESLVAMIEEVMRFPLDTLTEAEAQEGFSVRLSMPRLTPNEAWGNPDSQSRKDIDRIFASITRQDSIKARIDHINSFADPARAKRKGTGKRFNTILNMMMILEALQACLNDYSESSSGFVFEGFMAAVTGGKQISGRVGGTLPIEDFVTGDGAPVSLKLLSPKTPIHGSFTNLIDYLFIRGGAGVKEIKYLIGRKNSDDVGSVTQLMLMDFIISRQNFVDVMLASGNQELFGNQAENIKNLAQIWEGGPDQIKLMQRYLLDPSTSYNETLGMFKKNIDDQGGFNPEASKPKDPVVKQTQYAGELARAESVSASQQGYADAMAGREPDFESWLAANPKFKDPETKKEKNRYRAALKIYNGGYAEFKPKQPEEPEQLAESYFGEFHEREKLMMEQERQLMEAKGSTGGTQWKITAAATVKLANIADVDHYGELNLSNENIRECTDIYIEIIGENLMTLLKTTEEFTKNIGKYFSADRRSTAMNANKQAQTDGKSIVTTLAKESQPGAKDPDIE